MRERVQERRLAPILLLQLLVEALGKPPEEALIDLVTADRANVVVARFIMSVHDVREAMRRPWVAFEKPNVYSEGVLHVIVNGRVVLEAGRMTGEESGRPLFGPGATRSER